MTGPDCQTGDPDPGDDRQGRQPVSGPLQAAKGEGRRERKRQRGYARPEKQGGPFFMRFQRLLGDDPLHRVLFRLSGAKGNERGADQGGLHQDDERPRASRQSPPPQRDEDDQRDQWCEHRQAEGEVYDGWMQRHVSHSVSP